MRIVFSLLCGTLLSLACFGRAHCDEVVNVYSARHYDSDDAIYKKFEAETGIKVKVIEAKSDALLERIRREGERSPADVLITVDAGRLEKAESLLSPVKSKVLAESVPARLRHPEGLWFGLTQRVRVILVHKERVPEGVVSRYEDLANPRWRGKLLIRSSSNIYNQSLVASLLEVLGEERTLGWCTGIVKNLARVPRGGDRDQIRGVAAGEGDVAVANHYYYVRMLESENVKDRDAARALRVVFPNQKDRGAHVNLSGAGVLKHSPNRGNAVRLIEFLASKTVQKDLAAGSFEYPAVEGVELCPPLLKLGAFKSDSVEAYKFGKNNAKAVRTMDRASWR
ncbi:MAG: Fe(3+) ABC transporter substrate-binding protein [Planctomycetota bacterium]